MLRPVLPDALAQPARRVDRTTFAVPADEPAMPAPLRDGHGTVRFEILGDVRLGDVRLDADPKQGAGDGRAPEPGPRTDASARAAYARLTGDPLPRALTRSGACAWSVDVTLRVIEGRLLWGGDAVRGRWDNRFVEFTWLVPEVSGPPRSVGRARLMMNDLSDAAPHLTMRGARKRLVVHARLTDENGLPHRSRIPVEDVAWCVVPDGEPIRCPTACRTARSAPHDIHCHFITNGS